jgi:glucosamine-6-phosphate deaminase
MKLLKKDKLTVKKYDTRAEMGTAAAKDAEKVISDIIKEKGEINIIFAAAPSQNEMLENLLKSTLIDWERVNALHMDEYVGLPKGSEARFSHYLKTHIFDALPFKAVYLLDEQTDDAADVEALRTRYEALLADGPIDVVCMGIGENGHIAFNDPPVADFNDPKRVKLVELDDACRRQQVNDGCFPNFESTPREALTLTVPALTTGRRLICAVPGPLKAPAVRKTLTDAVSEACPATILRRTPNATLYVDAESFSLCADLEF